MTQQAETDRPLQRNSEVGVRLVVLRLAERLAGLLARKGYSAGLAFSVVREALGEAEDDEPHPDF